MLCYLWMPLFVFALFWGGGMWFFIYYPNNLWVNITDQNIYNFIISFFILMPLYLTPLLLRCSCFKKHRFTSVQKFSAGIVALGIWYCLALWIGGGNFDKSWIYWFLKCTTSPLTEGMILLLAALMLLNAWGISFVVLSWQVPVIKADKIRAICAFVFAGLMSFFLYTKIFDHYIAQGAFIYLLPCNKTYPVAKTFPEDKRNTLEALYKFISANQNELKALFESGKEIDYRQFLAMAAVSPALLHTKHEKPKFYVHFWLNEILYPLSDDLGHCDYWGRRLIVASSRLEQYYLDGNADQELERNEFLASKYLPVLLGVTKNNLEAVYKN